MFAGYLFSDQLEDYNLRRFSTIWNYKNDNYNYILQDKLANTVFTIVDRYIDEPVSEMLRDRLLATSIDDEAWSQALQSNEQDGFSEHRRIQNEIKAAERNKQTILANLKSLANPELVQNLEASYEANQRDIERLEAELEMLEARGNKNEDLSQARPAIQLIVERWDDVPRKQKRSLFEAFAHRVIVRRDDRLHRHLVVQWRDGTETIHRFTWGQRSIKLTAEDKALLKKLVDENAPQIEIMRAFPQLKWRYIQKRYAYHFGKDIFQRIIREKSRIPLRLRGMIQKNIWQKPLPKSL